VRPRVHRYLAEQVLALSRDYSSLPVKPERLAKTVTPEEYRAAREKMLEELSAAMKHAQAADICTRRGERSRAARHWWDYRRAIRRGVLFYGVARIFSEVGT
jgi:hypothetical protein